jgi:hypothetical protein
MTDVDVSQAIQAVEELLDASPAVTKPEKPKRAPGYDVYAALKNAAEGKPDSRVDSLEKLLAKIGDSAGSNADLVSLTVHYVKPYGSVMAVQAARPPAKSAVKQMAKMAGKSAELKTLDKADAEKVGTFVLSKKPVASASAPATDKKIKKPKVNKEKQPRAEDPRERIEANLKKLQKKQKEKAV